MKQLSPILFKGLYLHHQYVQAALASELVTASDDGIDKETLEETWLTPNIVHRKQIWRLKMIDGFDQPTPIDACYSKNGGFIGDLEHANRFIDLGIVPETKPGCEVCSIGFCEREQKWYGWSHRAIMAFGIGDDFYHAQSMWNDKGSFMAPKIIGSLEEARDAAINFSDDVS